MAKVYVLIEGDYYDNPSRAQAVVTDGKLAKRWENAARFNSVEEFELDDLSEVKWAFPEAQILGEKGAK